MPDRRQRFSHGGVQFRQGVLKCHDDIEMRLEQGPVMDDSVQRVIDTDSLMAKSARGNVPGDDRDVDYARTVDSGPIGVSPDKLNFKYTVSG
ncbi:hypothetical protein ACJ51O_36880 (plasmid) [Burkholderia pyrrocinia]|uniref:hypothetical protein n=1 Tax=Burkholderia pyrrocinia TaxID=60550 RepID=UPI0038B69D75